MSNSGLLQTTILTPVALVKTPEQNAILLWIMEGTGHAVVIARAGTGKTWIALEGVSLMVPEGDRTTSVCLAMFNADIAAETRAKIAKAGLRASAKTFHGAGWEAMLRAFKNVKLSGTGPKQAGFHKWDRIVEKLDIPKTYQSFAAKAMSIAKQRAFGITVRMSDPAAWLQIVDDFDLDMLISADFLDSGLRPREDIIKEALQWAFKSLKASNEMLEEVADHDDQIYGPLIRNLKMWENDWLIVDEAQDTNPARRLLARKMVKRNGRTLWIGDPKQGIYRFTGADGNAMDVITKEWRATTLKLTTTFRCPKVVVRLANTLVPDYAAGEKNIEGTYKNISSEEFFKVEVKNLFTCVCTNGKVDDAVCEVCNGTGRKINPKTMILCRNTAPLVKAAFKLIGQGIACRVDGKDIGGQIVDLINRWKSVKTIQTLRTRLEEYRDTQIAKLTKAGKDRQAESLTDRVETVFAVIEGLEKGATLEDLKAKVDEMFPKREKGEVNPNAIRLMTLHRSKGLEQKTVVFLGRQELIPSKFARKPEELEQEDNLAYVGLTRAQETLIEVRL